MASGVHAIPERVDSRGIGRIVLADYPPAGAWPLALGASSVIGAETRIPASHTLPGFAAGAGTRGKSQSGSASPGSHTHPWLHSRWCSKAKVLWRGGYLR